MEEHQDHIMTGLNRTKNSVLREVTDTYLAEIDINNPPSPDVVERELLTMVKEEFVLAIYGKDIEDEVAKSIDEAYVNLINRYEYEEDYEKISFKM